MAVVPIIISGVLYPKAKTGGNLPQAIPCTLIGNAAIYGLTIGGGPIIPPDTPPPDPKPPRPSHPIWGPPGFGPGAGFPDRPEFPTIPGSPPVEPPEGDLIPGWEFKAGWTEEQGWFVAIVPEDDTLVPTPSKKK